MEESFSEGLPKSSPPFKREDGRDFWPIFQKAKMLQIIK